MDQIWWERVPNAIAFITDITQSLLDEKSVVIQSEQKIPWYDTMASQVKDTVMQQDSSRRFEVIRNVDDPGPYLLQEFCKPEKRATYRPAKGYAKFFAESDDIVLHSRYLWVHTKSTKMLETWVGFVSEYIKNRGKNKESAVFILEWQGEKTTISKKGIHAFSFDDYINEYDRIVFSMLASSSVKEGPGIKNYLAELASNIAGNDIELCAACIGRFKEFLKEPYSVIRKIVDNEYRSDGGTFSYKGTAESVIHDIWLAQIKTIYPLIEEYRERFVRQHEKAIAKELPFTSSYGETYDDPKDVELGTLVFMADNCLLHISSDEYFLLKQYKDARNKLSHLNVLSVDAIRNLI